MNDIIETGLPSIYDELLKKCNEIGFTMPSDMYIGSLLKTLICSKPKSQILELGTGIGLTLSWMIDGLDEHSTVISVDNDSKLISIAESFFGKDKRVRLICSDGSKWINGYNGAQFDLIFADAWPGKYSDLDATLALLKPGGFYIIDDMSKQPNWPEGHEKLVDELIDDLNKKREFTIDKIKLVNRNNYRYQKRLIDYNRYRQKILLGYELLTIFNKPFTQNGII